MTKALMTTDPEKMRELMLAYPREYGDREICMAAARVGGAGLLRECRREKGHTPPIHVHARRLGIGGDRGIMGDPTAESNRIADVAWWFSDADS